MSIVCHRASLLSSLAPSIIKVNRPKTFLIIIQNISLATDSLVAYPSTDMRQPPPTTQQSPRFTRALSNSPHRALPRANSPLPRGLRRPAHDRPIANTKKRRAADLPALYRLAYARRPRSRESSFVAHSSVIKSLSLKLFLTNFPKTFYARPSYSSPTHRTTSAYLSAAHYNTTARPTAASNIAARNISAVDYDLARGPSNSPHRALPTANPPLPRGLQRPAHNHHSYTAHVFT
jgi:hypothetical protein